MDRAAVGQVPSQYFGFPCHSIIRLLAPQSSPSIIRIWYNRPINDRRNSGLGSTATKQINKRGGTNNPQTNWSDDADDDLAALIRISFCG
jgi:hypothetical protein